MPVAKRFSESAYERDEQLAFAMFEHAGIDAFGRGESMHANPEKATPNLAWAWEMGWRRAQFLFELALEKRSQEAERRKFEGAMMAYPPNRHMEWFA